MSLKFMNGYLLLHYCSLDTSTNFLAHHHTVNGSVVLLTEPILLVLCFTGTRVNQFAFSSLYSIWIRVILTLIDSTRPMHCFSPNTSTNSLVYHHIVYVSVVLKTTRLSYCCSSHTSTNLLAHHPIVYVPVVLQTEQNLFVIRSTAIHILQPICLLVIL